MKFLPKTDLNQNNTVSSLTTQKNQ